ncbi:hypothetical protein IP90_02205 [Luteimonas cucumeris]|uniref:Uncharacterized protein n=1 Tax=Luteimonas cucumeris TaxID=985012 RepID=A0A562L298_9GAMM|nr:hypothetical protein [Luteimonas cucumeris]TWI01646.1 hypothetical protein IP90_02205 [Luteimonas cucumeris]
MRVRPNRALFPPLLCTALVLGACVGLPASATATKVLSDAADEVSDRTGDDATRGSANRSGGVQVGVNPLWNPVAGG